MNRKNYQDDWALLAAGYHQAGLGFEEIARQLHLSSAELRRHAAKHPELRHALESGRIADPVEQALLRRAIGFRQSETTREDIVDRKTGEVLENCKCRTVQKEIPPDVRALLFWLKNRRPERWKERQEAAEDFSFQPDEDEAEL